MEIENMTNEDLKKLANKRYQDAIESGYIRAIGIVGRSLGKPFDSHYGQKYLWEKDGVKIFIDDYGSYMEVFHGGKKVVSTHYCECFFVPGHWQQVIESALEEALAKQEEEKKREEEKERGLLLKKLGIES